MCALRTFGSGFIDFEDGAVIRRDRKEANRFRRGFIAACAFVGAFLIAAIIAMLFLIIWVAPQITPLLLRLAPS